MGGVNWDRIGAEIKARQEAGVMAVPPKQNMQGVRNQFRSAEQNRRATTAQAATLARQQPYMDQARMGVALQQQQQGDIDPYRNPQNIPPEQMQQMQNQIWFKDPNYQPMPQQQGQQQGFWGQGQPAMSPEAMQQMQQQFGMEQQAGDIDPYRNPQGMEVGNFQQPPQMQQPYQALAEAMGAPAQPAGTPVQPGGYNAQGAAAGVAKRVGGAASGKDAISHISPLLSQKRRNNRRKRRGR